MQITITLNAEQEQKLSQIMQSRSNRSTQQVAEQIFELGMYQLAYRSKRNAEVYASQKAEREELKELRKLLKQS
jgi:hypothetical protein